MLNEIKYKFRLRWWAQLALYLLSPGSQTLLFVRTDLMYQVGVPALIEFRVKTYLSLLLAHVVWVVAVYVLVVLRLGGVVSP